MIPLEKVSPYALQYALLTALQYALQDALAQGYQNLPPILLQIIYSFFFHFGNEYN